MRIAVVSPYDLDAAGGVQDQVVRLTRWLRAAGHEAVPVGPGLHGPEGAVLVGSAVSVPVNRSRAPVALDPRAFAKVRSALRGFDVVHVHEPFVPTVGPAALRVSDAATVATFHADPSPLVRRLYALGSAAARRMLRSARVVTAVSPVAAGAVRPIAAVRIVPNGIDVAEYGHGVPVPGRVAFLGRDDQRKGLDVLLEAWPQVIGRVPQATLHVIGAERPDALAGVTFHGRVDDGTKRLLLAESEVFAAPNTGGESFGIVVLEAMASGCAVVASAIPAFVHVLSDAGELVAPGDIAGLADRLAALLTAPGRRNAMAERSRNRALAFDGSTVAALYLQAYEDALQTP